ncbi:MAG: hypothetical protein V4617_15250 [Gemmatimonadota bacterium]
MAETLLFSTKLATLTCCNCGMLFAMPAEVEQRRRDDHKTFYCPNGHGQSYSGKSEAELLRDQLAKKTHEIEQAQANAKHYRESRDRVEEQKRHIERRLSATQGVVTRHKRKIAAGKCPCCSAEFKNLAAHMKTQHPKWDPAKEAEVRSNG